MVPKIYRDLYALELSTNICSEYAMTGNPVRKSDPGAKVIPKPN